MYPATPENMSLAMRVAKRYPDNIYIQNYDELSRITLPNGNAADMGVQFDIYDQKHGLEYDALARAQYKHWRATVTGVPDLLSANDRRMLGLHDWVGDTSKKILGR